MNIKNRIKGITKIIGLSLLFVGVLEICARIEDNLKWDASLLKNYNLANLWERDASGRHGRPGGHFEKWRLNAFGFRSPEISLKKPKNVIRIAVMGASETFGLYESPGMEFPALIQKILDEKNPGRFQVINTSIPGMSLLTLTEYFQNWIRQFIPDIAILYPAPANYLAIEPPLTAEEFNPLESNNQLPRPRILRKIKTALQQFVPDAIKNRINTYRYSRFIHKTVRGHGEGWVWEKPPPERLKLFSEHLLIFIKAVQEAGTDIILATHANHFNGEIIGDDLAHMLQWRNFHPRASQKCMLDFDSAANGIILNLEKANRVSVIHLESLIPPTSEYFSDFAHFTDAGAYLVAEALADKILRVTKEN